MDEWTETLPARNLNGISLRQYYNNHIQAAVEHMDGTKRADFTAVAQSIINLVQFSEGGFLNDIPAVRQPYQELSDEHYRVPEGMYSIIQSMENGLPSHLIRLSHEVCAIEWLTPDNRCTVHCQNGERFVTDHVLVTVSLGVLKASHATLFHPLLPQGHIDAISNMSFGKANKVFLYWNKPFWKPGSAFVKFAWPLVTDEEPEDKWYRGILGVDEVLNNPNVLVSWVCGEDAEHMEFLSDDLLLQAFTKVLRLFLEDSNIPSPSKILVSRWCRDRLTRGAYSYYGFGSMTNPVLELMKPVVDSTLVPRVLFAGEAVSLSSYSTIHGAMSSGINQAQKLVCYKKSHRQAHSHL